MPQPDHRTGGLDLYFGLPPVSYSDTCRAYRYFGAHPAQNDGVDGWRFRVWAPNAKSVCLEGDFNGWDHAACPMRRQADGAWECFVPGLKRGDLYKFAVSSSDGRLTEKADPYAFYAELRPGTASRLWGLSDYRWQDAKWLAFQNRKRGRRRPMNIYEVHLGSWRRTGEGNFLDYRTTADYLVPYVKKMGYTHVELMPVAEHPEDSSLGDRTTGYFAPTGRFGSPDDFRYLVNALHTAGVGVLLDWVPAYFPPDDFGLSRFDGTALYESGDRMPEPGMCAFDFGRREVRCFSASAAMYWVEEFHIDGLCMDTAETDDGREGPERIRFFHGLNGLIHSEHPDVLTIAREPSGSRSGTGDALSDGFAAADFSGRWNTDWTEETLRYQKTACPLRGCHSREPANPVTGASGGFSILSVSHREVAPGKGSILERLPGDEKQKFAGLRTFLTCMMTQPGKKLLVMGTEFGQMRAWHWENSLDWHLLEQEPHRNMQAFSADLNAFYLENPPLWEQDGAPDGFERLPADGEESSTVSYARTDSAGQRLYILINFSPACRRAYRIGVDRAGEYRVVFSTDAQKYGGSGKADAAILHSTPEPCCGRKHSLTADVPALSGLVLKYISKPQRPPRNRERFQPETAE